MVAGEVLVDFLRVSVGMVFENAKSDATSSISVELRVHAVAIVCIYEGVNEMAVHIAELASQCGGHRSRVVFVACDQAGRALLFRYRLGESPAGIEELSLNAIAVAIELLHNYISLWVYYGLLHERPTCVKNIPPGQNPACIIMMLCRFDPICIVVRFCCHLVADDVKNG